VQALWSPVVELNGAVAVGPHAGLDLVEILAATRSLEDYHLLSAVAATSWKRSHGSRRARAAFERASNLVRNVRGA
jgi:predicted RNA polymerase sigma factor